MSPQKINHKIQNSKNQKWLEKNFPNWFESKSVNKMINKNLSIRTIQLYKSVLKHFFEFIILSPDDVIKKYKSDMKTNEYVISSNLKNVINSYKQILVNKGYKNSTIKKYLWIIHLFFEKNGFYLDIENHSLNRVYIK